MSVILYIMLFLLGCIMGSFAGVIMERGRGGFEWSRWKSIFGGRSVCPWCGQSLTWWQLMPLVGRLVQRGKCFRCGTAIPARYNWLEISMGAVFVFTAWVTVWADLTWVLLWTSDRQILVFRLLINRAFRAIIIADFFWYELNVYLWLFLVLWIMGRGAFGDVGHFEAMFLGAITLSAIYWGIAHIGKWYVRSKLKIESDALGEGDIMIAMVIGMLFNFLPGSENIISSIQLIFIYLTLSSVLGIAFWLLRLAIKGDNDRVLPYLPAMIVAFWMLLGLSEPILKLFEI